MQEHSEEESQFKNFRHLVEKVLCAGTNSSSDEFHQALFLRADQIIDSIQAHFQNEEAEVQSTLGT